MSDCGPDCWTCYGDASYCGLCYKNVLLRGECHCDDIHCEKFDSHSSESTKCTECKDGFYPEPSPEGDCLPCPADCLSADIEHMTAGM